MNKIFFIIVAYISVINNTFSLDNKIDKSNIIPDSGILAINIEKDRDSLTSLFLFARDSIIGLLALISITVFIFLWAKLIIARWNSEELKKVLMQFVYSIIWLAIVAMSWAAVKLISSLNF